MDVVLLSVEADPGDVVPALPLLPHTVSVLPPQASVTLHVGKRKLTLRPEDLQKFRAERGRKGTQLPRGLQRIDRVEVDAPVRASGGDSEE